MSCRHCHGKFPLFMRVKVFADLDEKEKEIFRKWCWDEEGYGDDDFPDLGEKEFLEDIWDNPKSKQSWLELWLEKLAGDLEWAECKVNGCVECRKNIGYNKCFTCILEGKIKWFFDDWWQGINATYKMMEFGQLDRRADRDHLYQKYQKGSIKVESGQLLRAYVIGYENPEIDLHSELDDGLR